MDSASKFANPAAAPPSRRFLTAVGHAAQVEGASDFVGKEIARLTKMKDDGSVAAAKKAQFSKRLNALSSFA